MLKHTESWNRGDKKTECSSMKAGAFVISLYEGETWHSISTLLPYPRNTAVLYASRG